MRVQILLYPTLNWRRSLDAVFPPSYPCTSAPGSWRSVAVQGTRQKKHNKRTIRAAFQQEAPSCTECRSAQVQGVWCRPAKEKEGRDRDRDRDRKREREDGERDRDHDRKRERRDENGRHEKVQ